MSEPLPFDETAFRRRLDRLEHAIDRCGAYSSSEVATVIHGSRRLLEELTAARADCERRAQFQRDQTLLPCPSTSATNQAPP